MKEVKEDIILRYHFSYTSVAVQNRGTVNCYCARLDFLVIIFWLQISIPLGDVANGFGQQEVTARNTPEMSPINLPAE
jgi:hypothetical protein